MLNSTLGLFEPREEPPPPQKRWTRIPFPQKMLSKSLDKFPSNTKAFKILTQIHFQKKTFQRPRTSSLPQRAAFKILGRSSLPKKKAFKVFGQFPFPEKKNFQFLDLPQSANKVWEFSLRRMILTYSKELVLKS
jgi:hypothetical protein